MLFSGMCLLKISWKFIRNSMAEQSSPKMPLLTVHTFSSWKCKCNQRNICSRFYCDFLNFPMFKFSENGYWIYGFCLFKGSCLIVDTCCWSLIFINLPHFFVETTAHSQNYCLCCRYGETLAVSKVKAFILQNLKVL